MSRATRADGTGEGEPAADKTVADRHPARPDSPAGRNPGRPGEGRP